jgi:hypothetical protein
MRKRGSWRCPGLTRAIALRQVNVKGTYLEQIQNNNRLWINVLEHGLADDAFSEKREFDRQRPGSDDWLDR